MIDLRNPTRSSGYNTIYALLRYLGEYELALLINDDEEQSASVKTEKVVKCVSYPK